MLTEKIARILARKKALDKHDLTRELRNADKLVAELEVTRDLTQHVVHVDCDAFYAAVEQLGRPELKEVPFAVGGGILTTCNYVARQYGCRSGMAGFVAKKLCPKLVLIKPNFEKYNAKAHEIREVLVDYDPNFESASIDEAYLNITRYCTEKQLEPPEAVEQMRKDILQKTQVTVSAGIAANAKLAKICSNMNKPNGQFVLPSNRNAIMTFMRDLPTRKVNGIGRVLERELLEIGVKTCGDLYDYRQYLDRLFGHKTYEFLMNVYLGLGRTKIQPAEDYERKSVGTESTFGDMSDPIQLRIKLRWTAEELEKDMQRVACKARTLCLKIKLHTYEVLTRQVVIPRAICVADDLYSFSEPMLTKLEQEMPGMRLRLMGLRCTHLVGIQRPDTMAFFGFKGRKEYFLDQSDRNGSKRKASEPLEGDEWEKWPVAEVQVHGEEGILGYGTPNEGTLEPGESSLRRHGKEIAPNPTPNKEEAEPTEEEWWDCPICGRSQAVNERAFNEHIDLCLSRQTIRDAVQADEPERSRSGSHESKRPKASEKKKGRPPHADPKQRKLFFG